ncbi:hypothetical protein BKA91DRAFT_140172 [Yarrowia lipolytica]|nr:hypothetical protein BKA91DRAFT_140172 [Yarrowia lipolytica]KAE8175216.1 hypothetical protein BKA90DRAFT_132298 [Yarrowia lipolytica]RMI98677.1 hypothetical protein BD777DRAFT_124858 [Yarrowia lipolytica]
MVFRGYCTYISVVVLIFAKPCSSCSFSPSLTCRPLVSVIFLGNSYYSTLKEQPSRKSLVGVLRPATHATAMN